MNAMLGQLMRGSVLVLWLMHLSGCVTSSSVSDESQSVVDTASHAEIVTRESLYIGNGPLLPALDINVVVFDVGPSAMELPGQSAVRKLETRLLPGLFREALVSSDLWGAVRVVPAASSLAPVNIETTIVASDGRDLVLDVQVVDATGEEWFSLRLTDRQSEPDDELASLQAIFSGVSNRMRDYWLSRTEATRKRLISITNLLYARDLAPDAFANYLDESGSVFRLTRMPSNDDPMLGRVQLIKNQEYLFCDAIDEQLVTLFERAGPTYYLWRMAAMEQANWLDHYEAMAASRSSGKGDGEFSRMQASYAAYRSYRMQEQALVELAEALDGESEPVVLPVQDAVVTLEGTLATQYAAWRDLLREIFQLEQGVLL